MTVGLLKNGMAVLALGMLVTGLGCGVAGIADVRGRVTIGGQPAPEGLTIEFVPVVPGPLGGSMAVVRADGRYVAVNSATGKNGVSLGMCVARLVADELTTTLPRKQGQMPIPKYDRKQFDEITRFEVKAGSNTVDLELTPATK